MNIAFAVAAVIAFCLVGVAERAGAYLFFGVIVSYIIWRIRRNRSTS